MRNWLPLAVTNVPDTTKWPAARPSGGANAATATPTTPAPVPVATGANTGTAAPTGGTATTANGATAVPTGKTAAPAGTPTAPNAPGATNTAVPAGTNTAAPVNGAKPATTAPATGANSAPIKRPPPSFLGGWGIPLVLLAGLGLLMWTSSRGRGKEEKKRKSMLESMKKGDRVQTIGGLIGSVADVRGDEVVLKVDEANNVKMRYVKSAIQRVLAESDEKRS